jgi:hypothetical protein
MPRSVLRLGLALVPLVAGCATDPFDRPGTWQSSGHNESNLRAMLENPLHISAGVEAQDSRGAAGAVAVDRLVTDRRRALPATQPGSNGAAGAPPAAASAADGR